MGTTEKSEYDLRLEELLRKADHGIENAEATLSTKKLTKVRKRKQNIIKRFRNIDTEVDQATAYKRIINSSSQYQAALELKQSMSSDCLRNQDPLARFKQNQRKFLLK